MYFMAWQRKDGRHDLTEGCTYDPPMAHGVRVARLSKPGDQTSSGKSTGGVQPVG